MVANNFINDLRKLEFNYPQIRMRINNYNKRKYYKSKKLIAASWKASG